MVHKCGAECKKILLYRKSRSHSHTYLIQSYSRFSNLSRLLLKISAVICHDVPKGSAVRLELLNWCGRYALCATVTQVFEGNSDSDSVKHSYLEQPITARFIRFQTVHWNNHPSMRVEIIGCQRTNILLKSLIHTFIDLMYWFIYCAVAFCQPFS